MTLRGDPDYARDHRPAFSFAHYYVRTDRPIPRSGRGLWRSQTRSPASLAWNWFSTPALNKSTAFPDAEREALKLTGLLPDAVESEDMQLKRVLQQLGHKTSDIDRYIYWSVCSITTRRCFTGR